MLIPFAMSIATVGAAGLPVAPAPIDCGTRLAVTPPSGLPRRLQADDLIETLDIGSFAALEAQTPFAISPDGTNVAVSVRRANVSDNSFCTGIYVIDLKGGTNLVDNGAGAAVMRLENFHGMSGFPTGLPRVITPRWSPDGQSLAFLKFVDGRTEVWKWDAKTGSKRLARAEADILDFRYAASGHAIIFKVLDDQPSKDELDREALSGYHFDDRNIPFNNARPYPPGPARYQFAAIDLANDSVRTASTSEVELLGNSVLPGSRKWAVAIKADQSGVMRLTANRADIVKICKHPHCSDIVGAPWLADGETVRFMRREGWAKDSLAIYEWAIGRSAPKRLFATRDLLLNCAPLARYMLCAREGSNHPRYLDLIDPVAGTSHPLFDPNPGFQSLVPSRIERLHWMNDRGIETFGDLVYPTNFERARRYPMIITQYESSGFLRGGTGDEFPIQLLAQEGYMVLSVQKPRSPYLDAGLSDRDWQRRDLEGFTQRRSILSAIETKVEQLVASGLVDPDKVGITGLSDGSSTVQFAALHSRLFSAGSVSGCCWEPSQTWLLGSAIQAQYREIGWPGSATENPQFWSEISLARNAAQLRFPILFQQADAEYLAALESFTALKAAGKPVDLYIFPDEQHIKLQPLHRANIYRRNIDWFNFWLLGKMPDGDPSAIAEAERWRQMRERLPIAPVPAE